VLGSLSQHGGGAGKSQIWACGRGTWSVHDCSWPGPVDPRPAVARTGQDRILGMVHWPGDASWA